MIIRLTNILIISTLILVGCSKAPWREGETIARGTVNCQLHNKYRECAVQRSFLKLDGINDYYWVKDSYSDTGQKLTDPFILIGKENLDLFGDELTKAKRIHGQYTEWNHDDVQIKNYSYKNGVLHGLSQRWYPNGQKAIEGYYENGIQQNIWKIWNIYDWEYSGNYMNDKKEGLWTEYYADKKIRSEGHYLDDKKEGLWTYWHSNGNKADEYNYKNGIEHGISISWYSNGNKRKTEEHNLGAEHGTWIWWYENGQLDEKTHFKNGKRNGSIALWYENGQPKMEGEYINDERVGNWTTWDEDGKISSKITYP